MFFPPVWQYFEWQFPRRSLMARGHCRPGIIVNTGQKVNSFAERRRIVALLLDPVRISQALQAAFSSMAQYDEFPTRSIQRWQEAHAQNERRIKRLQPFGPATDRACFLPLFAGIASSYTVEEKAPRSLSNSTIT